MTFSELPWYKPDPQFDDARLSATAWHNIAALESCGISEERRRDRFTFKLWLRRLRTGQLDQASSMMKFPFYLNIDDDSVVDGGCRVFKKANRQLQRCLALWLNSSRYPFPRFTYSDDAEWKLWSPTARAGPRAQASPDDFAIVRGDRSANLNLAPTSFACFMRLLPGLGQCEASSESIEILLSKDGRIMAAQTLGPSG